MQKTQRRSSLVASGLIAASVAVIPLWVSVVAYGGTQLPEGEAKALVERTCTRCHALEVITQKRFTRDQWVETISNMGVPLAEDEIDLAAVYLAKHFGPGTSPGQAPSPQPASKQAQEPATKPARLLVVRGGTLFDGTGRGEVEDATVIIEGDRVREVGGNLAVPPDAEVIDARGKTIIPGLIDQGTRLGTIEPGRLADIVIINGSPLKDISDTKNVDRVILGGKVLPHELDSDFVNPIPRTSSFEGQSPKVSSFSPARVSEAARDVKLGIKGVNFSRSSTLLFNDRLLPTVFVSEHELTVEIPPDLVRKVGSYPFAVVNPGSGGSVSGFNYLIVQ